MRVLPATQEDSILSAFVRCSQFALSFFCEVAFGVVESDERDQRAPAQTAPQQAEHSSYWAPASWLSVLLVVVLGGDVRYSSWLFCFVCLPREINPIKCTYNYYSIRVDEEILCQLRVLGVVPDFQRGQSRVFLRGVISLLLPSFMRRSSPLFFIAQAVQHSRLLVDFHRV